MEGAQIRMASPTTVDASLEYITVDKYQWPKHVQPKRARLDEDERKRRHREGQRQFMSRKRCRIAVLRREMASVELLRKCVNARQEQTRLEEENRQLRQRLHGQTRAKSHEEISSRPFSKEVKTEAFVGPAESEVMDLPDMEHLLCAVLLA